MLHVTPIFFCFFVVLEKTPPCLLRHSIDQSFGQEESRDSPLLPARFEFGRGGGRGLKIRERYRLALLLLLLLPFSFVDFWGMPPAFGWPSHENLFTQLIALLCGIALAVAAGHHRSPVAVNPLLELLEAVPEVVPEVVPDSAIASPAQGSLLRNPLSTRFLVRNAAGRRRSLHRPGRLQRLATLRLLLRSPAPLPDAEGSPECFCCSCVSRLPLGRVRAGRRGPSTSPHDAVDCPLACLRSFPVERAPCLGGT